MTSEQKTNIAREAILQFINKLKIEKIIYVDDKCSINELESSFVGYLFEAKDKTYPTVFIEGIDWEMPENVFRSKTREYWASLNEDKKRTEYLRLLTFTNKTEQIENSAAPLDLKNHLKKKIELLSPTEWNDNRIEILDSIENDKKLLCLFDIDFGDAGLEDGRTGLDFTSELLSDNEYNDKVYCGVFSHLFNVSEEYEKKIQYINSHNLPADKFYTISKKRIQNELYLPGLAEGIRNTLLISKVDSLKTDFKKILKKAYSATISEIDSLPPDSFNHSIFYTSRNEGVWEIMTLLRISKIISDDNALNEITSKTKRRSLNSKLKVIREFEKIKTGEETPFNKSKIIDLRKKEIFFDDPVLNTLNMPLSNGDIFEINSKNFILLCQPCNLLMRKNGKRSRDFNKGVLLEIYEQTPEKFKKLDPSNSFHIHWFPIFEEDNLVRFVMFPNFKNVSLIPLDLVVFNSDGVARIDLRLKQNIETTLQASWEIRYKSILKKFENYNEQIRVFRALKSNNKDKLKDTVYIQDIFQNFDMNINDSCFSRNRKVLQFDIKRILNYREPFSSELLSEFSSYLSRAAFGHDFSS